MNHPKSIDTLTNDPIDQVIFPNETKQTPSFFHVLPTTVSDTENVTQSKSKNVVRNDNKVRPIYQPRQRKEHVSKVASNIKYRKRYLIYAAFAFIWIWLHMRIRSIVLPNALDFKGGKRTDFISFLDSSSSLLSPASLQHTTTGDSRKNIMSYQNDRQHFIKFSNMWYNDHVNDHYSGMWWVRSTVFMNKWSNTVTKYCRNYEGASFKLFNQMDGMDIYMTRDWLNFNVEHLSQYFKTFDDISLPAFIPRLISYMNRTTSTSSRSKVSSNSDASITPTTANNNNDENENAFRTTLAILPIYFSDETCYRNEITNYKHMIQCSYMYALSATLVSLWNVGIKRIVLAGNFDQQPSIVREAIDIFYSMIHQNHQHIEIEYVYIAVDDATGTKHVGIPCNALEQLYMALNNQLPETQLQQWFGSSSNDGILQEWKHIYFSEPDLILHVRSSIIKALSYALENNKLIAAHRFQLLHHEQYDAPPHHPNPYPIFLPNVEHFANPINLYVNDDDEKLIDSCCDSGNYWPGIDEYMKGDNFWYLSGFHDSNESNRTEAYKNHYRIYNHYPFVRLQDGMNLPFVHAHGRVCIPGKGRCGNYYR